MNIIPGIEDIDMVEVIIDRNDNDYPWIPGTSRTGNQVRHDGNGTGTIRYPALSLPP